MELKKLMLYFNIYVRNLKKKKKMKNREKLIIERMFFFIFI